MKHRFPLRTPIVPLAVLLGMASGLASAQSGGDVGDKLGVSLRLGLEFETEPDATIDLQGFGSRFTWEDQIQSVGGRDVSAFIDLDFGLQQDVGPREIWLGVGAGAGTIKGGTQFRAFYDMTTSFTDVGWWDTCYVGIGCDRSAGVLKYESELSPTSRFAVSATLSGDGGGDEVFVDEFGNVIAVEGEDDFIDQLEGGAIFESGDLEIGFAAGLDLVGETGFGIGAAARTTLVSGLQVGALFQFVTEDYSDEAITGTVPTGRRTLSVPRAADDSGFLASVSAQNEQFYGLATIASADETGIGLTGGYVVPLAGGSLAFAEVSGVDDGAEGSEFEFLARAVFVYHFGADAALARR